MLKSLQASCLTMTKLPFSPPTPDPNKAPQPPRPQQPSEDNASKSGIAPSKPKAAFVWPPDRRWRSRSGFPPLGMILRFETLAGLGIRMSLIQSAIISQCAGATDCRGGSRSLRSTSIASPAKKIGFLDTTLRPPTLWQSSASIPRSLSGNCRACSGGSFPRGRRTRPVQQG